MQRRYSSRVVAEGVGFVPKNAIFCAILAQSSVLHRANTVSTPALLRASTFTDSDGKRRCRANQLFLWSTFR